jgi:Coenzyme PQQ synthesis protein D (PqqD).
MKSQQEHLHAIVNQDGAAVLDTAAGTITTLNATGAIVWRALEHGEDVEDIVERISRDTGEAIIAVRKDVTDFIESLRKHGLLPG